MIEGPVGDQGQPGPDGEDGDEGPQVSVRLQYLYLTVVIEG